MNDYWTYDILILGLCKSFISVETHVYILLCFTLARKSQHRFPSVKDENEALVNNYHPIFDRKSSLENYFFDFLNETALTSFSSDCKHL